MKFAHVLSRFQNSAWYIREESLVAVAALLESRLNGVALSLPDAPAKSDPVSTEIASGVAVVDIEGMLGKRLSLMETMCGGCDYDSVLDEVEAAPSLPAVSACILRIDSPGGTVVGCSEAFSRLRALCASTSKPVVAFTETECCSAAYWLASATDAIYATPSSMVGSTGAKIVLREQSEKDVREGVKFTVFKSGTMKDIGSPHRPVTEEEAKVLQARVDQMGADFRSGVLSERPGVAPECFTSALFYSAAEGLSLNLVDQVVSSLAEVVADLAPGPFAGRR